MVELPRDPRSIHVGDEPPTPVREPLSPAPSARRRRWAWLCLATVTLVVTPTLGFGLVAWSAWTRVDRVDVSSALEGGAVANYLVVGTDSRAGVSAEVENAEVIFGEGITGERTDSIAVVRVENGTVSLLAVPRDLYLPIDGHGRNRINAAFAFGGPELLIRTVQRELGIPVHHYLEVDFAGFLGLVDALGGVTINFAHPTYDARSGLAIETAGSHRLDGAAALAFVRSRRFTELIEGEMITDPTSDLGRVRRQQEFLAAVMSQLGATRNPFTLLGALQAVADNVRVDDGVGIGRAISLGWTMRGAEPRTATVPADRFITESGADVLVLNADSEAVLAAFRR